MKAFLKWLKVKVVVDVFWDIADELNETNKEKNQISKEINGL